MFSESEDDELPFATTILQEEDFMLPTSLLWGKNQWTPLIMLRLPPLENTNQMNLIMKILIEEG